MIFALVTLTGLKFREDVYEVILPTEDGEIAILPSHMPLVTIVKPGVVKVRRTAHTPEGKMDTFTVTGGIADVIDDHLRLLTDQAD